ncbi:PH domain-containing protein [Bacillus infantis]|uniref:PH domain-containing protein n=1 Tax=Bacillus infantis TaxID=324767 RepID=UPI0021554F57|nr:PH domain-containing protein [Bacillus infantis]MCR6613283.1 PH domain-containing protein [Bacillus infantis]
MEVKMAEKNGNLQISWLLNKTEIPLSAITEVSNDDTYAGQEKEAIRIGFPSGNTDRVVIKTEKETYILFTSMGGIKEKILTLMNNCVR